MAKWIDAHEAWDRWEGQEASLLAAKRAEQTAWNAVLLVWDLGTQDPRFHVAVKHWETAKAAYDAAKVRRYSLAGHSRACPDT